ncbi:MAG: hypothetical protein WC817_01115 [Patescibacteria group bacterium]|jgi:hypothetical protein
MEEDIRKMLEENLQLSREMHTMMKKVRRSMAMRTVVSVIYLILIVAPLIIAFFYLPPLIKPYLQQYQELLGPMSDIQRGASSGAAGTSSTPSWQEIVNYAKSIGVSVPDKTR